MADSAAFCSFFAAPALSCQPGEIPALCRDPLGSPTICLPAPRFCPFRSSPVQALFSLPFPVCDWAPEPCCGCQRLGLARVRGGTAECPEERASATVPCRNTTSDLGSRRTVNCTEGVSGRSRMLYVCVLGCLILAVVSSELLGWTDLCSRCLQRY